MSILRPFRASDLFKFNNVNLDIWTETYGLNFYFNYLSRWPDLCYTNESSHGRIMGYSKQVLGKAEGNSTDWHGHITAVTVAPEFRRLSVARKLIDVLELVSDDIYRGYFVDLYVRCSNQIAIDMYEGMGYSVFRRVGEYYGGVSTGEADEDAFDMRKPLSRDPNRRSVRMNGRDMIVSRYDVS